MRRIPKQPATVIALREDSNETTISNWVYGGISA